jgi:DNA mismatch repair protein MutL
MSKIQLLPEHVIDQIKAGEVVERPSMLLKELIENSIDAQATQISINLIANGLELVEIIDNGSGIPFDDLPLAFSRHATSKISNFDDLYKLYSYGFRGEALASIASVCKVVCHSIHNGVGGKVVIESGNILSHQKDSYPNDKNGTSIYIKELFYNTPARLKFMQSVTSEKNQLYKIIYSFILCHPEIEFNLKWDEKDKITYPALTANNLKGRIEQVYHNKNNTNSYYDIYNEYEGIKVHCFLAKNSNKGNSSKNQFIFVNKRYVQDIQFHKIILNTASSVLWPTFESGNYCVFIEVPPQHLDINVHPNKTLVKIFESHKVASLISSSIKTIKAKEISNSYPSAPTSDNGLSKSIQESLIDDKDLISNRDIDFQLKDNYSGHRENVSQENSTLHFELNRNFHLIKLNPEMEHFYLVNISKLLNHFFIKNLQEIQTPNTIPLLISEPIKAERINTELINELLEKGFEIDKLDDYTFALRGFHHAFMDFPIIYYIKELIQLKALHPHRELSQLFEQHIYTSEPLPSRIIKKLIMGYTNIELIKNNIISELTSSKLQKIFDEK